MAVDEALLLHATQPTLRLYGWHPHAVSLGYFQSWADFADLPAGTPIVRRLTGGGAIHHGDEITFALAVDAEVLKGTVADSYRVLHDAALTALHHHGIACHRVATGEPPSARPDHRWCFRTAGRDDVVTTRGKLLGSAQRRLRRSRDRILHHGSLVVSRPALTSFVGAVRDAVPAVDPDHLRDSLVAALAAALGLPTASGTLTDGERAAAERLMTDRYANPAFLRAR